MKSKQAYAVLLGYDQYFTGSESSAWLKSVSLSQLGVALEFTIHNSLHMRYSTERPAAPYRGSSPENDGAPLDMSGKFPRKWPWDQVGYDWLADPYGAAVNPTFWKIHGYVDHVLELWLKAQGKTRVSRDCGDDTTCYAWHGTWVGEMPTLSQTKEMPLGASRSAPIGLNPGERMRFQHVGVVDVGDDSSKGPPPLGSANPVDPFTTAVANLSRNFGVDCSTYKAK